MQNLLARVRWQNGIIPAAITDAESHRLLVLCYMNEEALKKTVETRLVHVFRRSKGRLMLKEETSGHTEEVTEIWVDCEGNSIEIRVKQNVAACHAGYFSCYYRRYDPEMDSWLIADERVFDPGTVYRT